MSIINEIIEYSPKIEIINKDYIIRKLARKQAEEGGDRKFFNQYWQPFAWAAIIGFLNERRIPITGKYDSNVFNYSVINNQSPNILKSLIIIAIGKFENKYSPEKEIELLKNPKEIIRIIDEYANGGFEIISRKLNNDPDYFYDHNIFIEDLLKRIK